MNRIKEMNKRLDEREQEIERLNKGYCKFKEECGKYATCLRENQLKEIERLNNIIDKLKIDIENGALKYTYDTDYNRGLSDAFIYMNDRIKELKGSDKE